METGRKRVAIIGGGLAGLATAAYAARAGHHVTLFERAENPGGRGGSTRNSGYIHNFGPHALYLGGAAESVLRELGVPFTGKSPDLRGVAVRGGRTYTLPTGGRSMVATRLFGVRARLEAGKQMLALRKSTGAHDVTVAEWLRTSFHEPAARDYLQALIRLSTYANAPETTSLADAARQFSAVGAGVLYIDGGWQTLVDGLVRAARDAGAEIRTSARVESVDYRARALRLATGEQFAADAVVLALPPTVAGQLTGSHAPLALEAERALPALAACLDVGVVRLPNPRRNFGLGIDVPYYFSVHSRFARLAPTGRTMISVAKYTPAGEKADAERDLRELEAFLDTVQPGWRRLEEHRQYLPHMVVSSALPLAERGGISGRPSPVVPGMPGIFVAGDWVGDGGWITDGTLGSARLAANAVGSWLSATPARELATVS
jgi:phytoene dehydrogenase-like protein